MVLVRYQIKFRHGTSRSDTTPPDQWFPDGTRSVSTDSHRFSNSTRSMVLGRHQIKFTAQHSHSSAFDSTLLSLRSANQDQWFLVRYQIGQTAKPQISSLSKRNLQALTTVLDK